MRAFCEHTPIEEYVVSGIPVFVKRDDRYGARSWPRLGKLRGLRPLVRQLYDSGIRTVGCWDSRVSKLGEGLAAVAKEHNNLTTIVCYPTRSNTPVPPSIIRAAALGAEIQPIRGNVTPICYAQARRIVNGKGGAMLPFGLNCELVVQAIAQEAARTPLEILRNGTLILCAGSGVTLAGLLRGLPIQPHRIFALSSGRAIRNIRKCVAQYVDPIPPSLTLLEAITPYDQPAETPCPFPSHPNYDRKAWQLLTDRVRSFSLPVLFWNIGA